MVDHPQIRVREAGPDQQVLDIFAKMRIEDEEVRNWSRMVLVSQTKDSQAEPKAQRAELSHQEIRLIALQDKLPDLRLRKVVDKDAHAVKQTQLWDRLASIEIQ